MKAARSALAQENDCDPLDAPMPGLRAEPPLDDSTMAVVRRKAALNGCKWDAQVEDVTTLAPFPLVMKRSVWERLASAAERLAAESAAAELELSRRPKLLRRLGLPRALERLLKSAAPLTPSAGRVIRFDFHFTTEGWRISEANSDVPGGFSEASYFTALMAAQFAGLQPAGDPGKTWAQALFAAAGPGGTVALLSAPGYLEDHQVTSYLAARLREQGCISHLAKPEQIRWRDGKAHLEAVWYAGPLSAIVRFYQAEWLARLREGEGWEYLFCRGRTPVANPALAVISESKRFPLTWDELDTPLPAWRALLPETRAPREADWRHDDRWLLKTAFCNTGDTVSMRSLMRRSEWRHASLGAWLSPARWLAQRRFESVPISTPAGPRHVCVGVYTVNGRAAGAYARMASKPLINYSAVDVALLLEK